MRETQAAKRLVSAYTIIYIEKENHPVVFRSPVALLSVYTLYAPVRRSHCHFSHGDR